jgi:hypothetical protein
VTYVANWRRHFTDCCTCLTKLSDPRIRLVFDPINIAISIVIMRINAHEVSTPELYIETKSLKKSYEWVLEIVIQSP